MYKTLKFMPPGTNGQVNCYPSPALSGSLCMKGNILLREDSFEAFLHFMAEAMNLEIEVHEKPLEVNEYAKVKVGAPLSTIPRARGQIMAIAHGMAFFRYEESNVMVSIDVNRLERSAQ